MYLSQTDSMLWTTHNKFDPCKRAQQQLSCALCQMHDRLYTSFLYVNTEQVSISVKFIYANYILFW